MTKPSKPLSGNVQLVFEAIKKQPMTAPEIARATGLSGPCIRNILADGRANNTLRRSDWKNIMAGAFDRWVPMYGPGNEPDVERPPLQSIEERRAKQRAAYRAKAKANNFQRREQEHKARIAAELNRPAFRHWMDVALFGEARA